MALAWVPGLVFSAYSFEGKEFLLGLVPVTIFSFLSWLYLKGPMSRYGQERRE